MANKVGLYFLVCHSTANKNPKFYTLCISVHEIVKGVFIDYLNLRPLLFIFGCADQVGVAKLL